MSGPQSQMYLGPSFNSIDDKKGEKKVDLHVWLCAAFGKDV